MLLCYPECSSLLSKTVTKLVSTGSSSLLEEFGMRFGRTNNFIIDNKLLKPYKKLCSVKNKLRRLTMKFYSVLIGALFLMPALAFSGITGKYRSHGSGPNGKDPYTSVIEVTRNGQVYSLTGTYSTGLVETGTGVRNGDTLSIVFLSENRYGVQFFKIRDNKLVSGSWAWYGENWTGIEKLKKIK